MKKLNSLNLGKDLNRLEMKNVFGGSSDLSIAEDEFSGCCIAYGTGSTPQWSCGFRVSDAQSYYANGGRGYCCASCR